MLQQCYYRIYTYVSRSHLLTQTWQTNDNGTDNDNYCQDCSLTEIRQPMVSYITGLQIYTSPKSNSHYHYLSLPPLCLKAPPSLRTQFKSLSLLANKGIIYFRRVHLSVPSENHKSTFLTLADFYVLPKR